MPEDESVPATNDPIEWYDRHSEEVVNREDREVAHFSQLLSIIAIKNAKWY